MKCAWNELLAILPQQLQSGVDKFGRDKLQELRLRTGLQPQLILFDGRISLPGVVQDDMLRYIVNLACRYSPWTAESAARGYITTKGGHRIGLCGQTAIKDGKVTAFTSIRSMNIRVARDFPGLAEPIAMLRGNLLLLGPPGSGKTTLLRDLVRQRSLHETVSVADSRGEVFPDGFSIGNGVDILSGCDKPTALEMLLRTMGPDTIAVDEITAQADCEALIQAAWCGVRLVATAHAANLLDLEGRKVYRPILRSGLFDWAVVLKRDKSFTTERMIRCNCE